MTDLLLAVLIVVVAFVAALQTLLLFKKATVDLSPLLQALQAVENSSERLDRVLREEMARNREQSSKAAQEARVELSRS